MAYGVPGVPASGGGYLYRLVTAGTTPEPSIEDPGGVFFTIGAGPNEPPTGHIRFAAKIAGNPDDTEEILRIDADGGVYLDGQRIVFDPLLYACLRRWIGEGSGHGAPQGTHTTTVTCASKGAIRFQWRDSTETTAGSVLRLAPGGVWERNGKRLTDPQDVIGWLRDWITAGTIAATR